MAEWWMEGALERRTDVADPVARSLRRKARFHIAPNMNPDGSFRGHLRTNAAGAYLNPEWPPPSLARSPEVHHVLARMKPTGVAFAMDVHGAKSIPPVFIARSEPHSSHPQSTIPTSSAVHPLKQNTDRH